jgi:hypothetical protein
VISSGAGELETRTVPPTAQVPKGCGSQEVNQRAEAVRGKNLARRKIYRVSPTGFAAENAVDVLAVLLITNYFLFFDSIGLTQRHFGLILAE